MVIRNTAELIVQINAMFVRLQTLTSIRRRVTIAPTTIMTAAIDAIERPIGSIHNRDMYSGFIVYWNNPMTNGMTKTMIAESTPSAESAFTFA